MAFGEGGWRLIPERSYLIESDTYAEFIEKHREADTILSRLQSSRLALRSAHKRTQQLRNRLHKARKAARGEGGGMRDQMWETERKQRGRELAKKLLQQHNDHLEKVEELEKEHEQLARHIDKNFCAVQIAQHLPNTSPPDKRKIHDEVGRPVELVG